MQRDQILPPHGQWLGFNFYFADQPSDSEKFADIVDILLDLGAIVLEGQYHVYYGNNAKSLISPPPEGSEIAHNRRIFVSNSNIRDVLRNPDHRIFAIELTDALGIGPKDEYEFITYVDIPVEYADRDHPPFAIYCNGDTAYSTDEQAARKTRSKVYRRFIELVKRLKPTYGAITVEYNTCETPSRLRDNPSTLIFEDFYVAHTLADKQKLAAITGLYKKAHIENLGHGSYISSWLGFNPDGTNPDESPDERQPDRVAEILFGGKA